MNILSSAHNNPALILLQSTLQALTLASPAIQQSGDTVQISQAAKQLAQATPTAPSQPIPFS